MNEQIFLGILLIHFLADFGLQTHEQSQLKSYSLTYLFYHVGVYSLVITLSVFVYSGDFEVSFKFGMLTFLLHYLTDFITSRIGKPFWEKEDYHNGFVVVGFDQVLHYIQLIYTFKLLLII
jgi:membrane-bound metal-dependent hydrolase YbcI (DUF457 family)